MIYAEIFFQCFILLSSIHVVKALILPDDLPSGYQTEKQATVGHYFSTTIDYGREFQCNLSRIQVSEAYSHMQPSWLIFNATSGVIHGIPQEHDAGPIIMFITGIGKNVEGQEIICNQLIWKLTVELEPNSLAVGLSLHIGNVTDYSSGSNRFATCLSNKAIAVATLIVTLKSGESTHHLIQLMHILAEQQDIPRSLIQVIDSFSSFKFYRQLKKVKILQYGNLLSSNHDEKKYTLSWPLGCDQNVINSFHIHEIQRRSLASLTHINLNSWHLTSGIIDGGIHVRKRRAVFFGSITALEGTPQETSALPTKILTSAFFTSLAPISSTSYLNTSGLSATTFVSNVSSIVSQTIFSANISSLRTNSLDAITSTVASQYVTNRPISSVTPSLSSSQASVQIRSTIRSTFSSPLPSSALYNESRIKPTPSTQSSCSKESCVIGSVTVVSSRGKSIPIVATGSSSYLIDATSSRLYNASRLLPSSVKLSTFTYVNSVLPPSTTSRISDVSLTATPGNTSSVYPPTVVSHYTPAASLSAPVLQFSTTEQISRNHSMIATYSATLASRLTPSLTHIDLVSSRRSAVPIHSSSLLSSLAQEKSSTAIFPAEKNTSIPTSLVGSITSSYIHTPSYSINSSMLYQTYTLMSAEPLSTSIVSTLANVSSLAGSSSEAFRPSSSLISSLYYRKTENTTKSSLSTVYSRTPISWTDRTTILTTMATMTFSMSSGRSATAFTMSPSRLLSPSPVFSSIKMETGSLIFTTTFSSSPSFVSSGVIPASRTSVSELVMSSLVSAISQSSSVPRIQSVTAPVSTYHTHVSPSSWPFSTMKADATSSVRREASSVLLTSSLHHESSSFRFPSSSSLLPSSNLSATHTALVTSIRTVSSSGMFFSKSIVLNSIASDSHSVKISSFRDSQSLLSSVVRKTIDSSKFMTTRILVTRHFTVSSHVFSSRPSMFQTTIPSSGTSPIVNASNVSFTTKSLTNQLSSPASVSTTEMFRSTTSVATVNPNTSPVVVNSIGRITAYVGRLLVYKVPYDTFYDIESGYTPNLFVSCRYANGLPLQKALWIVYDNTTQTLSGLPLIDEYRNQGINGLRLEVIAMDMLGATARDVFNVYIENSAVDIQFGLTAKISRRFDEFQQDSSLKIALLNRIVRFYNTSVSSDYYVNSLSNGSVLFSWSDTTISGLTCNRTAIIKLRSYVQLPSGSITSEFAQAMLPDFPVLGVGLNYFGVCLISPTTTVGPAVPAAGERASDVFVHFVVPIIAAVLLLALIIASFIFISKRRRNKPSFMEKSTFRKGRPILLPEEYELDHFKAPVVSLPEDYIFNSSKFDDTPPSEDEQDDDNNFLDNPLYGLNDFAKPPPAYHQTPDIDDEESVYESPYSRPPPSYQLPPIFIDQDFMTSEV